MSVITKSAAYMNQQFDTFMVTPEKGFAIKMINDTGSPSVKGSVLSASSAIADAFELQTVEYDCVSVVYEDGVADGQEMWVVISGVAEVLLEDGVAASLD